MTVSPPVSVPDRLPGFVTFTSSGTNAAFAATETFAVRLVLLFHVTATTVTPVAFTVTVAPGANRVPVIVTGTAVLPCWMAFGETDEIVGVAVIDSAAGKVALNEPGFMTVTSLISRAAVAPTEIDAVKLVALFHVIVPTVTSAPETET